MDFEMELCAGCTTCEMACSYKHIEAFNNLISSMEIVEKEKEPGYKVRLIEKQTGDRIPCDGCFDVKDDYPLCVRYCPHKDELMEIIEEFRKLCINRKKVD